jgi:hypothetical protein
MRLFLLPEAIAILLLMNSCAPQPPFKPVGTIKQLMESTVHPSAEVVFESVGTIISVNGMEEIAPKNDQEWATVEHSALTLAEAGNLLMMPGRAKQDKDWIRLAQALVDVGVVAHKAAQAKNAEALFEAGGQIYETCQSCHSHYWPKDRLPLEH